MSIRSFQDYITISLRYCQGRMEKTLEFFVRCKYNNYGFHGTGIATAADSLAAVKKFVYDDQSVLASELIDALKNNYEGQELLCNKMRYEAPKMGNNDDFVDRIAVQLLNDFADALKSKK